MAETDRPPAETAARGQQPSDLGPTAQPRRLSKSADRQRSGCSSPRSVSAPRVSESNNSSRRQRDRRLLGQSMDFGPTMSPEERRGRPRPAGSTAMGGTGCFGSRHQFFAQDPVARQSGDSGLHQGRASASPAGKRWSPRLARSTWQPGYAPTPCFGKGERRVRRAVSHQGPTAGKPTADRPCACEPAAKL